MSVRSLIRDGRIVFLDPGTIENVASSLPGFVLSAVENSGTGPVALEAQSPQAGVPATEDGKYLTLVYAHSEGTEGASNGFFQFRKHEAPASDDGRRVHDREPTATTEKSFALHQNQPNPFGDATRIGFSLPGSAMVRLDVFDSQGRRVRVLARRAFAAGEHFVDWDRRNGSGVPVKPGIYFYRIEAGANRDLRKMIVLP